MQELNDKCIDDKNRHPKCRPIKIVVNNFWHYVKYAERPPQYVQFIDAYSSY